MQIAYRLAALALTLCTLAFGGAYIGHLRAELHDARQEARTAQETLKRTQATLKLRERQRVASDRAAASAKASLQAALTANQTWAQAPVPKEVQDALCARLDCGAGPDGLRHPDPGSP